MRALLPAALSLLAFMSLPRVIGAGNAQAPDGGLSVPEFRDFAKSLPQLSGRIQAVRLFEESAGRESSVALATWGVRAGWQLFVFGLSAGQNFQLEWKSGKLDDTFAVGDPASLRTFNFLDGSEGVSFEGCLPHNCPDVFSIVLYVPSKRTAFRAKYVMGKVTYSPSLDAPEDRAYKAALDDLVKWRTER